MGWGLVVIALAASVWVLRAGEETEELPLWDVALVERGPLLAQVAATGTLVPRESVQVGSQVSGRLQRIYVDYNSRVEKGQLLAEIEPSLFEASLAQARAVLAGAEAARDKARVLTRDAARQLERLVQLSESRVVSESNLDAARFALEAAQAEERALEATLGERRASLARAQVDVAHTRIYSPIDGVVVSRNVDVGQTVAASLQAPTLFVIAGDLSRMQIEAQVDEAFIGEVEDGQLVTFSVFAHPDRVFEGQLAQIRLDAIVESSVVKYNCIIDVDNADHVLKPGMTATVAIQVDERQDAPFVPNEAVRFVPDPLPEEVEAMREELQSGQTILWLVEDDETLRPMIVQLGLVGAEGTEIVGDALSVGDPVAIPATDSTPRRGRRRGLRFF